MVARVILEVLSCWLTLTLTLPLTPTLTLDPNPTAVLLSHGTLKPRAPLDPSPTPNPTPHQVLSCWFFNLALMHLPMAQALAMRLQPSL